MWLSPSLSLAGGAFLLLEIKHHIAQIANAISHALYVLALPLLLSFLPLRQIHCHCVANFLCALQFIIHEVGVILQISLFLALLGFLILLVFLIRNALLSCLSI